MNNVENIEEKNNKKISYGKMIKIYLVPLFAIGIFIFLLLGPILSTLGSIFDSLNGIATVNEQINSESVKLRQLNDLNKRSTEILSLLDKLNEIVIGEGTESEVVEFRNNISQLADENNLEGLTQKLNQISLDATQVETTQAPNQTLSSLTLTEVPFIFEIRGSFNDLKSFLGDLSQIKDFVVIKEMELSVVNQDQTGFATDLNQLTWQLKTNVVKYKFNNNEALNQLYQSAGPTAKASQKLIDYLNALEVD